MGRWSRLTAVEGAEVHDPRMSFISNRFSAFQEWYGKGKSSLFAGHLRPSLISAYLVAHQRSGIPVAMCHPCNNLHFFILTIMLERGPHFTNEEAMKPFAGWLAGI